MCSISKDSLRRIYRGRRNELGAEKRRILSGEICERVLELNGVSTAARVLLYYAIGGEVDLSSIALALNRTGKQVYLPKVTGREITCVRYGEDTPLKKGAYGIPEPESNETVLPGKLDVILVPGVAFTRDGIRLGQGGGYYDRLLAQTHALKIGVCYSCQMADTLPMDAWDMCMDAVICESGAYFTRNQRVFKSSGGMV